MQAGFVTGDDNGFLGQIQQPGVTGPGDMRVADSIDDEPVKKKATNLLTAMPRLASSAAMTARIPPSVLTRPPSPPCPT